MYKVKLFCNGIYCNISRTFGTEKAMLEHIKENEMLFPTKKGYVWKRYKLEEIEI